MICDFSWRDRDDIIRFIFNRFKHTALIAVYNTFKFRASVREIGKVFGLPKEEIDKLSSRQFVEKDLDHLSYLVLVYSKLIKGFPNYLGIHAGGASLIRAAEYSRRIQPLFCHPKAFPPPCLICIQPRMWVCRIPIF
ncbi:MAG: hypothetical protein U5K51_08570 [Flavobacteriaceae bacterium]|nr:hypothetical protein [Flavobacteriaceae bacterium]